MADKSKPISTKPMRMNLFATWEVEKSTPNCIPRLCSLALTRIVVTKPLENDLQSVIIAVKMQNSKRILRSNDIPLSSSGLLDTELDLTFSLQYPHFLKHDTNHLQVVIQRRKKYKNRPILGFKTLAMGQINMSHVLQKAFDKDLHLYSDEVCGKESSTGNSILVGKVELLSVTSQPVDHDYDNAHMAHKISTDRSPDVDLTDDEDVPEDPDFSSNEDNSDSEPMPDINGHVSGRKFKNRSPFRPNSAHRRKHNIKQKFITLLRRFKVSEDVLDSEHDPDESMGRRGSHAQDLEELFDELENLSESDNDLDTISVIATPKPKLRPFFTGRGSDEVLDILETASCETELSTLTLPVQYGMLHQNHQSTPDFEKTKQKYNDEKVKNIVNVSSSILPGFQRKSSPQTPVMKDLSTVEHESHVCTDMIPHLEQIFSSDETLPENLVLVNISEWQGKFLVNALKDHQQVVRTSSSADVRAAITWIVNKLQRFCNTNSHTPNGLKIVVAGGDSYLHSVLWPYVEQFSSKSPDWQSYLHFLFIPIEPSSIAACLSLLDERYGAFFTDQTWKDVFESKSEDLMHQDLEEIQRRITIYVKRGAHVVQVPIAEAMLTCKEKNAEEESSQIFVPFINEACVGTKDGVRAYASDADEVLTPQNLSSSPTSTHQQPPQDRFIDTQTPPNSPNVKMDTSVSGQSTTPSSSQQPTEVYDLQLDYWCQPNKSDGSDKTDKFQKKDSKASLKTTFRSVQIYRLPHTSHSSEISSLTMAVTIKEKKQKILRMAKKSKDTDAQTQLIEGINRVICTSKSQNQPLTVFIDSVQWHGVKFFQISSQWQTHLKTFPLVLFDSDKAS